VDAARFRLKPDHPFAEACGVHPLKLRGEYDCPRRRSRITEALKLTSLQDSMK
jgi:hypothetical protein